MIEFEGSAASARASELARAAAIQKTWVRRQGMERLMNAPPSLPTGPEERLLAGLLSGGRQAWQQVGDLVAADFEDPNHRALYAAIVSLLDRRHPLGQVDVWLEFQAQAPRLFVQTIFQDVIGRWREALKPSEAPALVGQLGPLVKAAAAEREARRQADPTRISAERARELWGEASSWATPVPASPRPTPPAAGWAGLEIVEKQR